MDCQEQVSQRNKRKHDGEKQTSTTEVTVKQAKSETKNESKKKQKEEDQVTPLYVAVCKGHLEIASFLVDEGAELEDGLVLAAAQKGNMDVLKYLIEQRDYERESLEALEAAVVEGDPKRVQKIADVIELEEIADAEYVELLLKTAVTAGDEAVLETLLIHGLTPEDKLVTEVVSSGSKKLAAMLVNYVEQDLYDERVEEWMNQALKNGHVEIMDMFVHDFGEALEQNMMDTVVSKGDVEMVKFLVKGGLETPTIHKAVAKGDLAMVKLLMEHGGDVMELAPKSEVLA